MPIYLLTNRRGSPRRQDGNLRRVLNRVLAGAKITKHHTIYDLRDTFATTHLLQDWGKITWVSTQLGHASVSTTEKHYYKFKPSAATAGYVRSDPRGKAVIAGQLLTELAVSTDSPSVPRAFHGCK